MPPTPEAPEWPSALAELAASDAAVALRGGATTLRQQPRNGDEPTHHLLTTKPASPGAMRLCAASFCYASGRSIRSSGTIYALVELRPVCDACSLDVLSTAGNYQDRPVTPEVAGYVAALGDAEPHERSTS
jgi:hypothetical protein